MKPHDIPTDVIKRRYANGIKNLFELYLPIVNVAMIFDNTQRPPILIAEKSAKGVFSIVDEVKFNELKQY